MKTINLNGLTLEDLNSMVKNHQNSKENQIPLTEARKSVANIFGAKNWKSLTSAIDKKYDIIQTLTGTDLGKHDGTIDNICLKILESDFYSKIINEREKEIKEIDEIKRKELSLIEKLRSSLNTYNSYSIEAISDELKETREKYNDAYQDLYIEITVTLIENLKRFLDTETCPMELKQKLSEEVVRYQVIDSYFGDKWI